METMRALIVVLACALAPACAGDAGSGAPPPADEAAQAPRDAQHQNLTGPHGDHTPRHGGMVLMNGDVHYEVVLSRTGNHAVWFTDAVRNDLPASVASRVTMEVDRPNAAPELLQLAIDETGEAWVADGRPIEGPGVMIKLRYALQGEPHEIEVPFVPDG
jgi:hypothetical protein